MTQFDRRTFIALGGALVLGGVAACAPKSSRATSGTSVITRPSATTAAGRRRISSVAMVGDSLTQASTPEIVAALAGAGIPTAQVDGKTGRRIEVGNGLGEAPISGVRTITTMLAAGAKPDAWVIELGTNDVGSYAKPEQYAALIDQVLALLPAGEPLVWVNVYRVQYPELTAVFNVALQQRLQRRPRAIVADWFGLASAKDQQVLSGDNVHPNGRGQAALALLVVQALQRL